MAAPKRSEIQIEKDREQIAEWYLQGWSQRKIAEKLKLALSSINRDIKAIREQWKQRTTINLDEYKTVKLVEIANSKKRAWEGWERSCEEFKAKTGIGKPIQKTDSKGNVIGEELKIISQTIHTETRNGDPRFLSEVNKLISEECKLLGLYAPQKNEHTGKDGGPIMVDQFKGWTKEDLLKYAITGTKPRTD